MREIKFRVWDKDVCAYIDRKHTFDFTNYLRLNFDEGNGIAIDSLCPGRYSYEQYTGLKDKNGKEIYEGDIVEFGLSGRAERGYVAYADEYASFEVYSKRDLIFGGLFGHAGKVVGNIHENPELLGGQNETNN